MMRRASFWHTPRALSHPRASSLHNSTANTGGAARTFGGVQERAQELSAAAGGRARHALIHPHLGLAILLGLMMAWQQQVQAGAGGARGGRHMKEGVQDKAQARTSMRCTRCNKAHPLAGPPIKDTHTYDLTAQQLLRCCSHGRCTHTFLTTTGRVAPVPGSVSVAL